MREASKTPKKPTPELPKRKLGHSVRVHEISHALNLDPKATAELLCAQGVPNVRNFMSMVSFDVARLIVAKVRGKASETTDDELAKVLAREAQEAEAAAVAEAAFTEWCWRKRQEEERRERDAPKFVDDIKDAAWAIADLHFGVDERDAPLLQGTLSESVATAEALRDRFLDVRMAYLEEAEMARGLAYADAIDEVRRRDAAVIKAANGWAKRWRDESFTPPLASDGRTVKLLTDAVAWYEARVSVPQAEPEPDTGDSGAVPPEYLPPILPKRWRRNIREAGKPLNRRRPNLWKPPAANAPPPAPPKPKPMPVATRAAKLTDLEARLIDAVRDNPGLSGGKLERVLRVKTGTIAGVLDALIHRGLIENRSNSAHRPRYHLVGSV